MRRTLLVGGLLTCVTTIGVAAFAPGCAGDGADANGSSNASDGGGGTKGTDGSFNLNTDGSSSGGGTNEDGAPTEDVWRWLVENGHAPESRKRKKHG